MTLHRFQVIVTNAQTLSSAKDCPSTIIIFSAGVTGRKPDFIAVHQDWAGKEMTDRDLIVIWKKKDFDTMVCMGSSGFATNVCISQNSSSIS